MHSPLHSILIVIGIFLCLIFPESLFSNSLSDSLLVVARDKSQTTQNRLSAYTDLVFHFESSDPEKAIQLGNEGLSLPGLDSLNNDLARLYVNMAFVHYASQNYEDAIPVFEQAAVLYAKAGEVRKEGIQYINIGVMHRKLGNYSESIQFQLKSLEKFDETGDLTGQINVYMNIGNIYIFQNHPELAFPYYEKAYNLSMDQSDSVLIADAANSIANGFDHLEKKDTALYYYLQAITGYGKHRKWIKKAKSEHNVALIYMGKEDYKNAEKMLASSLGVFKQAPSVMDIEKATVQMSLARVYELTGRQDLAIKNFEEALEVFRNRGAKTEEEQTLGYLSKLLARKGLYKEAYNRQSDYMKVKDSIQNSEITSEILELTKKYESEKKQKDILELQNKNEKAARAKWFTISISLAIISILVIVFILYNQKRLKERERFKIRLQQSARELDILRHNIAHCHSHQMLPFEYTLNRDEVNTYLKETLSERELDVFMLLLEGKTNKTIAEELFVSVNTVKFHLQNIYLKLDVDNRTDAILSVSSNKEELVEEQVLA
jgi:DNA-binding CsgD family transcriptional regulator